VFKFVSKGDNHDNESALFYNGQRIATLYATVTFGGEIMVQVEDGNNKLMTEWEDFLEESD
jgi:hypothetical protein